MRPISLRWAGVSLRRRWAGVSLRRRWADVSLRGKTLLVVAIPTVALVLTVAAFASAQRSERRASDHVTQTLEVHGRIAQIRRTLLDAESGVRGYLLTGNADWLEPFETAQPRLTAVLDELATLVVDDEGQIERLAALEPVVGTWYCSMSICRT